MAHIHGVSDIDTHFIIDPITRAMKNETLKKTTLILGDHNSERFTFELPRIVEGHDMATCNKVEVHFLNMDAETKQTSKGIYIVDDFGIDPDDEKKVVCSWLIDQNATKYKGVLNFVVRFACTEDGTNLDYVWSTAIYSGVSVADGICNTENVLAAYIDVLEKWKAELYESETAEVELIEIDDFVSDDSPNLVTSGACKRYFDFLFADSVNTKYSIEKDGNNIVLKGTDGSQKSVAVSVIEPWQSVSLATDGDEATEFNVGSTYQVYLTYNEVVYTFEFVVPPQNKYSDRVLVYYGKGYNDSIVEVYLTDYNDTTQTWKMDGTVDDDYSLYDNARDFKCRRVM
jgi:hypothetical protein